MGMIAVSSGAALMSWHNAVGVILQLIAITDLATMHSSFKARDVVLDAGGNYTGVSFPEIVSRAIAKDVGRALERVAT